MQNQQETERAWVGPIRVTGAGFVKLAVQLDVTRLKFI